MGSLPNFDYQKHDYHIKDSIFSLIFIWLTAMQINCKWFDYAVYDYNCVFVVDYRVWLLSSETPGFMGVL